MMRFDLQRLLPAHLAYPFAMAVEAIASRHVGAALLYAGHRLLRLLLAGRDGWDCRASGFGRFRDLGIALLEPDAAALQGPLSGLISDVLSEPGISSAIEDFVAIGDWFLKLQRGRESDAGVEQVENLFARLTDTVGDFAICTAGPERPDLVYEWTGARGFVATREAVSTDRPVTLVRSFGSLVPVGPALPGTPPLPLMPFCGPEGTSWWEDPQGRVFDASLAPAPLAPMTGPRALGRLLQWHIEPDQDGLALAQRLVEAGEEEAAGEVMCAAILWVSPQMSAGALDRARDFLSSRGLSEQLAATDAFLLLRLEEAEGRLRNAADWAGVANVLLQKQMLQHGADKVLTVQRLANLFRERLNDHESAFYCLLSAVEVEPQDESLLAELMEETTATGKHVEAAGRLLEVAKGSQGKTRARVAGAAGRLFLAAGHKRKAWEAFLVALDGAPDDRALLEEAAQVAAAVSDNDALLALLARQRDAASDNRERLKAVLSQASVLKELGRLDEAITEWRRAILIDPNCEAAFDAMVKALMESNRPEEALREFRKVLSRQFEPVMRKKVLKQYAELLVSTFSDLATAAAALEEAFALDPSDRTTLDALESLYERMGTWQRMLSLWRRRIELQPDQAVPILLRMADAFAGPLRDTESALACVVEAARRDPQNKEARERIKRLHEAAGLWAEVCRDLEREADTASDPMTRAMILARMGELYETRLGMRDRAKAAFSKALEHATGQTAVSMARRLAELHRLDQERDKELKALAIAVKYMPDDLAADLLATMGKRALEEPEDREAARQYLEAAVKLNPVHAAAVEMLAGLLLAEKPERVPALVEPLAAKAAGMNDAVGERRLRLLAAQAAAKVGDVAGAIAQYRRAVELDSGDFRIKVLLARLLTQAGNDKEAFAILSEVLTLPDKVLGPGDRTELNLLLGRCAARLGDHKRALEHLDAAFRMKGTADVETLKELIAVAEAANDARHLVDYLDRLLALETDKSKRLAFMLRLGDLWKDALSDPAAALRWYKAAQHENPTSKAAVHKCLDAAVAVGDYAEAKTQLVALMEMEQDGLRRAQYHYGVALLARDSLKDNALAMQHLASAIELNPDFEEAVSAQEDLLVKAKDHDGLASMYQVLARHHRLNHREDKMLATLRRLGACYEEKLHNLPLAAETYREILKVAPSDVDTAERLANVLTRSPGKEREALEAHRAVLALDPTRASSYRAVRQLCGVVGDADGAWCAAAALYALGQANDDEKATFEARRQAALKLKRDSLPPEAFRKLIVDEAADEGVARVLHILYTPLRKVAPRMWKQPRDLGMSEADLVKMNERGLFQNMTAAASKVLGIPLPRIFRARGRSGIAKVPFDPPALAVGDDVLTAWRGKELRFSIARALVSFSPGFLLSGIADPGTLRVFFLAGLKIAFPDYPVPGDAVGVEELAAELVKLLSPEARNELNSILTEFRRRKAAIDLHGFLAGVDRTAARSGLFMANDLLVAKAQLAEDSLFLSELEFGDRLTDLCAYAVSARYAELRKLMLQL